MELDRLAALGSESVDFVSFFSHLYWHPRVFPCRDATQKIYNLEAFFGKHRSGIGRAFPTSAIHGNRLVSRQGRLRLFNKAFLFDIDIEGIREVAFDKLRSGPHIEQNDIGAFDAFSKRVDLCIFVTLLAAGGGQSQKGK